MDTLSDEVLSLVLYYTVYDGCEFSDHIEYADISSRVRPFLPEHASFAQSVLLVNRHFHCLGLPLLWRYVVVRSLSALSQIAALSGSLGHHCRRFETRFYEAVDPSFIQGVLRSLPLARVVVFRNFPRAPFGRESPNPDAWFASLTDNCPEATRIQLESTLESPTLQQVVDIINSHPCLQSFVVTAIASRATPETAYEGPQVYVHLVHGLRSLSFGAPYSVFPSCSAERPLDAFLAAIGPRIILPNLTMLHIMQYSRAAHDLARRVGPQLAELLFVGPHLGFTVETPFWDLCPSLETGVWLVKDWPRAFISRDVPSAHPTVRRVFIVLVKSTKETPQLYVAKIREACGWFSAHAYPALESVWVVLEGGVPPIVEHEEWFKGARARLAPRIVLNVASGCGPNFRAATPF
jgi:hypothetical protein